MSVLSERLNELKTIDDFKNVPADLKELVYSSETKMLKCENSFLGNTKCHKFWVFNLPRLITCPGATELCKKYCYQIDSELILKAKNNDSRCLVSRKVNLLKSFKDDFVDNMVSEIIRKRGYKGKIYVRIHASGDFYDEEYLKKWIKIALIIKKKNPKNYFMAYTKSFEILDKVMNDKDWFDNLYKECGFMKKMTYKLCDTNIHFLASEMDDTSEDDKPIMKKYDMVKYIVTSKENANLEKCGNIQCAVCMKCYHNPKTDIGTILR